MIGLDWTQMLTPGVLLIFAIDMFMLYRELDTSLLLFLKGHVDKPVKSDEMFYHFGKIVMINVT